MTPTGDKHTTTFKQVNKGTVPFVIQKVDATQVPKCGMLQSATPPKSLILFSYN